jgi:glycosyltransferase involved in cell wall biosynthesis
MNAISVIIPTWNRAHTIKRAIMSALNQTYPPYEVLICDDGSTDNTEKIVKSIADSRIRWLPGKHSGLPAIPRNRGIQRSQGEWLAFLDSDDEWLPDKLDKQVKLAKKFNYKAVTSNAYRFLPDQGIIGNLISWEQPIITFNELINNNWIITSSVLIHHSLIATTKGFPENKQLKAIEDYSLWLRIVTENSFAYVNEPLIVYYDDADNSIRKQSASSWQQRKDILSDFLDWLKTQPNKLKSKYYLEARKAYSQVMWQFYKQNIKIFLCSVKNMNFY